MSPSLLAVPGSTQAGYLSTWEQQIVNFTSQTNLTRSSQVVNQSPSRSG